MQSLSERIGLAVAAALASFPTAQPAQQPHHVQQGPPSPLATLPQATMPVPSAPLQSQSYAPLSTSPVPSGSREEEAAAEPRGGRPATSSHLQRHHHTPPSTSPMPSGSRELNPAPVRRVGRPRKPVPSEPLPGPSWAPDGASSWGSQAGPSEGYGKFSSELTSLDNTITFYCSLTFAFFPSGWFGSAGRPSSRAPIVIESSDDDDDLEEKDFIPSYHKRQCKCLDDQYHATFQQFLENVLFNFSAQCCRWQTTKNL